MSDYSFFKTDAICSAFSLAICWQSFSKVVDKFGISSISALCFCSHSQDICSWVSLSVVAVSFAPFSFHFTSYSMR